jgi:hypothetical protein
MVQTGSAQGIKVTLLGTGTPVPAMNRFGPSIRRSRRADIPLAGRRWFMPDTPSSRSRGWLSGSLVDRLARRLGSRQASPCLGAMGNEKDDVASRTGL